MVIIRHNLAKCECFFASMTWIWLRNYRESVSSSWVYILVCLSLVKQLNAVYCTLLIGKYNTISQQWNSTTLKRNHHYSDVILFPAKSNTQHIIFQKGWRQQLTLWVDEWPQIFIERNGIFPRIPTPQIFQPVIFIERNTKPWKSSEHVKLQSGPPFLSLPINLFLQIICVRPKFMFVPKTKLNSPLESYYWFPQNQPVSLVLCDHNWQGVCGYIFQ